MTNGLTALDDTAIAICPALSACSQMGFFFVLMGLRITDNLLCCEPCHKACRLQ